MVEGSLIKFLDPALKSGRRRDVCWFLGHLASVSPLVTFASFSVPKARMLRFSVCLSPPRATKRGFATELKDFEIRKSDIGGEGGEKRSDLATAGRESRGDSEWFSTGADASLVILGSV